jgi:hypothetical protein
MTTLTTTVATTTSLRRHRTESNSNGETVGAEGASSDGSMSGTAPWRVR